MYTDWAVLVYGTRWEDTKRMAVAIAEGITEAALDMAVELYNCGDSDKIDVMAEIYKSRLVLPGFSATNKGILYGVAALLEMIWDLGFRSKKRSAEALGK